MLFCPPISTRPSAARLVPIAPSIRIGDLLLMNSANVIISFFLNLTCCPGVAILSTIPCSRWLARELYFHYNSFYSFIVDFLTLYPTCTLVKLWQCPRSIQIEGLKTKSLASINSCPYKRGSDTFLSLLWKNEKLGKPWIKFRTNLHITIYYIYRSEQLVISDSNKSGWNQFC